MAGLTGGLLVAFRLALPAADTGDEAALGLVILWVEFNMSFEDVTVNHQRSDALDVLFLVYHPVTHSSDPKNS